MSTGFIILALVLLVLAIVVWWLQPDQFTAPPYRWPMAEESTALFSFGEGIALGIFLAALIAAAAALAWPLGIAPLVEAA